MSQIISCPSCHRQVQIPESLRDQDVQCPTCGATFLSTAEGSSTPASATPNRAPESGYAAPGTRPQERADRRERYAGEDDYEQDRSRPRRRRDLAPHRGTAVLVLGILSLVVCLVGLVLGIIAWVMGQNDIREIRAGRMDPDGEGLTNAGRICGIIGTCLNAALIVFYILYFVLIIVLISRV